MSFEEIYKFYSSKVFRLCMGYLNDIDWAKDVTQECFIIVWKQLPSLRDKTALGAWVYRIATNLCSRQIEKQRSQLRSPMPADVEDKINPVLEEKVLFLYKCISELPELDRVIISLELEDVDQSAIASIVGIKESNVRVRIHRIKEKLTDKFKLYEK